MIRRFVHNPILAHVLFGVILASGLFCATKMRRETFPNFSTGHVQVTVVYPGAAPAEIEEAICIKVEEEIRSIEGVEEITSSSQQGLGTITAKLESDVENVQTVLSEIRTQVERIDFPKDAEKPIVAEVKVLLPILKIALAGDVDEGALKTMAESVRTELLNLEHVSHVEIFGTRKSRILVQMSREGLETIGFDETVRRIQEECIDLPGGSISTAGTEVSIRTSGRRRTAKELESLILYARRDGTQITLGQVATVVDGYERDRQIGRFDGQPCIQLVVFKSAKEDQFVIADEVHEYVTKKKDTLPSGMELRIWTDYTPTVRGRLESIGGNLIEGFYILFPLLVLFLGLRLAFWVTLGIPTSFLGAFVIFFLLGGTMNMVSMFGFILVLGILCDDSIVISENVYAKYREGLPPLEAAIVGTQEVASGVTASSFAMIAAFMPIFLLQGGIGKIARDIPIIVGAAIAVSYIEAIVILPTHLGHSLLALQRREARLKDAKPGPLQRVMRALDRGIDWFINVVYIPFLGKSLRWRGLTIGAICSLPILSVGLIQAGVVEFTLLSEMDSDWVRCRIELAPGTSVETTNKVAEQAEEAVIRLREKFGDDVFLNVATTVGGYTGVDARNGSNLCEIHLALRPAADGRTTRSPEILAAWRELTGELPALSSISFGIEDIAPVEDPIQVRLVGSNVAALRNASATLRTRLSQIDGVVDVVDNDKKGNLEYVYTLRPQASALGITTADLARALQTSYQGQRAFTIQRGRESVRVDVLLPEEERRSLGSLDEMRLRPSGSDERVPIELVAERRLVRGSVSISRVDQQRAITVSARVDEAKVNAESLTQELVDGYFPAFEKENPGVRVDIRGQYGQTKDLMGDFGLGIVAALVINYLIISISFRSFLQPLIIMSIVPPSFFGALLGHWVMGIDLSFTSLIGFIGLAGIVVNDAIVMVEFFNGAMARGVPFHMALADSGASRFRQNLLTSGSTFFGLLPMVLDKYGDAATMQPLAVTIAFGILSELLLVLVLIPALLFVINDFRRGWHWLWQGKMLSPEEVEPASTREDEEGAAH